MGLAGLATDQKTVLEKLKFRTNLFKLREDRELSPKVARSPLCMFWECMQECTKSEVGGASGPKWVVVA